jgi:hypothetical protein
MRYIANKSFEKYGKFREGEEVSGIPDNQMLVLERLGHVRRADLQAEPRRRGRPPKSSYLRRDMEAEKPEE